MARESAGRKASQHRAARRGERGGEFRVRAADLELLPAVGELVGQDIHLLDRRGLGQEIGRARH